RRLGLGRLFRFGRTDQLDGGLPLALVDFRARGLWVALGAEDDDRLLLLGRTRAAGGLDLAAPVRFGPRGRVDLVTPDGRDGQDGGEGGEGLKSGHGGGPFWC